MSCTAWRPCPIFLPSDAEHPEAGAGRRQFHGSDIEEQATFLFVRKPMLGGDDRRDMRWRAGAAFRELLSRTAGRFSKSLPSVGRSRFLMPIRWPPGSMNEPQPKIRCHARRGWAEFGANRLRRHRGRPLRSDQYDDVLSKEGMPAGGELPSGMILAMSGRDRFACPSSRCSGLRPSVQHAELPSICEGPYGQRIAQEIVMDIYVPSPTAWKICTGLLNLKGSELVNNTPGDVYAPTR